MQRIPTTIGPYSLFVRTQPNKSPVYFAGVVGSNAETGNIEAKTFKEEAEQAFKNLQIHLDLAGVSKNDVVKATCFLTAMEQFDEMNKAYADYFQGHKPARSTVAVKALPKGAKFEIEVLAFK